MTNPSVQPPPDFAGLRHEYMQNELDERDAAADPITQFILWFNEATAAGAHEPNAMTLATSTRAGIPSARMVLLKGVDERGFTFFTHYLSRKGNELNDNPNAALVFYWPELERQVRVEGEVSKTTAQESTEYFITRPPNSRIGAAVSPQSRPVASRAELEKLERNLRERYPDGNVPCPPDWGGYRVRPRRVEFWQGRRSRLHDRIEYLLDTTGKWRRGRLAP